MTKETDLIIKIAYLENEADDFREKITAQNKEILALKDWKSKCDQAALKWGSFAMGILTLGAILMTGIDKAWDKLSGILSLWIVK